MEGHWGVRWRRIAHLLCTLCLGTLCAQDVFRATRDLDDLTMCTGRLSSVRVAYGMSRSNYVVFRLQFPPTTLGLDMGVGRQAAQQLAAQVQEGDTLAIYYDASGTLLRQELNTLVYRIDTANKGTLYSITQMHRRYWLRAALCGLVMFAFIANPPARGHR